VLAIVLIAALASSTTPAATELEELLAALAARADASLAFTETRRSELLDEPIEVSGTLHRTQDGRLVRETTRPRATVQTLSQDHVEIRRPDGYRQRFSLDRAPELRVLRQALVALLDGDRSALEAHFELAFDESDPSGDGGWSMRLTPLAESALENGIELELRGESDRLSGLTLDRNDGEALRMRFETAQ